MSIDQTSERYTPDLAAAVDDIFRTFLAEGVTPDTHTGVFDSENAPKLFFIARPGDDPIGFDIRDAHLRFGALGPHIHIEGQTIDGQTELILNEESDFTVKQQEPLGA